MLYWLSGLVTTTFHAPVAAPVIGQLPPASDDELMNVKLAQFMLLWPDCVSITVAPERKFVPPTEVTVTELLLVPDTGLIEVTVGAG